MKQLLLILTLSSFFACTTESKKTGDHTSQDEYLEKIENGAPTTEQRKVKSGEVDKQYEVILDSVYTSWQKLEADEFQRINDIKRLLQEISYFSEYDTRALKKMESLVIELEGYVYDQNKIPNFEVVSQNDQRIDEITDTIFTFVDSSLNPKKEYPLIRALKIDIKKSLMSSSLELSSNYSHHVLIRNNYVEENKEKLKKLGYTNLEKWNTFFDMNTI